MYITVLSMCDECGNDTFVMHTIEPPTDKQIDSLRQKAGTCARLFISKESIPSYTIVQLEEKE